MLPNVLAGARPQTLVIAIGQCRMKKRVESCYHDRQRLPILHHGSYDIQRFTNLRAAINEVSQEDDLAFAMPEPIARARVPQLLQQSTKLVCVSVNITNQIVFRVSHCRDALICCRCWVVKVAASTWRVDCMMQENARKIVEALLDSKRLGAVAKPHSIAQFRNIVATSILVEATANRIAVQIADTLCKSSMPNVERNSQRQRRINKNVLSRPSS